MTNVTLERTAPTQNAPATYMPQAQGQAADRRIKEKAPADAPAKMGVRNLDLYYKDFHALKSIDLQFPENQVTALIGPSGCGKSTLLKSLNRMNDLVEGCRIEGEITLDGEDAYRSIDVNNLRRRVGMVFQQPNPFPMSVYDNVAFGPRTHGIKKREDLDAIVEQSLRDRHLGRDEGSSEEERARVFRRPAAAPVHRARVGGAPGSAADGRGYQRARPHLHR